MGEVATTLKAFEQQLHKAVSSVPQVASGLENSLDHDFVQLKFLAVCKVDDVCGQYCAKLGAISPLVLGNALLQAGMQLM